MTAKLLFTAGQVIGTVKLLALVNPGANRDLRKWQVACLCGCGGERTLLQRSIAARVRQKRTKCIFSNGPKPGTPKAVAERDKKYFPGLEIGGVRLERLINPQALTEFCRWEVTCLACGATDDLAQRTIRRREQRNSAFCLHQKPKAKAEAKPKPVPVQRVVHADTALKGVKDLTGWLWPELGKLGPRFGAWTRVGQ